MRRNDIVDILIYLYFILIPLEDALQTVGGTYLKYIAILIIVLGILSDRYILSDCIEIRTNRILIYLAFLGLISSCWALDFSTALSSSIKNLMLVGVTLIITIRIDDAQKLRTVENSIILGGLISVVYVYATQNIAEIMQQDSISTEVYRITTTEGSDANGSAARLLMAFALVLWRVLDVGEKKKNRVLYLILTLAIGSLMLLSGSRTALIAMLSVLVVYIISGQGGKIRTFITVILIGGILYLFAENFMAEALFNRIFSTERYTLDTDTNSRTQIWQIVIKNILPSLPIWGYGIGNAATAMSNVIGYYRGIHNTYLTMLVEFGLLGIPSFIALLFQLLRSMFSNKLIKGLALLTGMMVFMMFIDTFRVKYMWAAIAYSLVLIELTVRGRLKENSDLYV